MGTIDKDEVKKFAQLGVSDMDSFLKKEIVPKLSRPKWV
jgi:hypothetical protein